MHFPFPPRVERIRNPGERASERLRFMVDYAMLVHGEMHLTKLCREAGYNHSSIIAAFKRGSMTTDMAIAVQKLLGSKLVRVEELKDPLLANNETTNA